MSSTQPDFDFSEKQKQRMKNKDITEDEVGECISSEMEEGIDQDQAIAICLSKLESGSTKPSETDSLENPQFSVGDFVRWDFAGGSAEGEIIDMTAEVGDSMSAGGNTFTIEEDDDPLYKIQEFDDEAGGEDSDGEFTNNVVKFEDSLRTVERPDAAPETAPRNRSKDKQLSMQERLEQAQQKQEQVKRVTVQGKDVEIVEKQEGTPTLNVPIQALTEDRDGDYITEKGQQSIIRQLESGQVGLFPNHGVGDKDAMYDFRDLFGKFISGDNTNGTTIGKAVLRKVNDPDSDAEDDKKLHPMAKELVNLLEQDMPVGFSVGFIPTDTHPREEGEGQEIMDLDLMEVSAVGIPSNPDAMPAAMSQAASQTTAIAAKQMAEAGFDKNQIVENMKTALNDTMTDKNNSDGQKNKDSKSTEKQLDEDQVEMITAVVGDAIDRHMTSALEDIQEDLMNNMDEETEEDEADEDMEEDAEHDEEDEEEMSQEQVSDQTEDSDGKEGSAESENDKGLDEDQKTVDKENEGRKIQGINNEKSSEKQDQESSDPFTVREALQN